MDKIKLIKLLEKQIPNSKEGLPEEVFYFVSRITPLINVDLLIKDDMNRTLLSWRDDEYCGTGWHIPGGIVRFKETLETRIKKVATIEINADIDFDPNPIAINQSLFSQNTRGHFVSFLYKCFLPSSFVPKNENLTEFQRGYLQWHNICPENLIKPQEMYKPYISGGMQ
jgi:colanic acid biosynthesis protein WcaH